MRTVSSNDTQIISQWFVSVPDLSQLCSQAPLSRLETGQYLNDRYEAMEDRLNVRTPLLPLCTSSVDILLDSATARLPCLRVVMSQRGGEES